MVFNRLPPSTFRNRSSLIAKRIVGRIQAGEYDVGSKLPPERTIAEQMGVGRPAIREAICALQIVGLVESRPGAGTYVMSTKWNSLDVLQKKNTAISLLEEGDNPFEALEARRAVESHTVKIVALRRSAEDLAKLRECLDRILNSIEEKDYDALLEADRDFHEVIAAAAKNSLLEKIIRSLMDVMELELWTKIKKEFLRTETKNHLIETKKSHEAIYEAIASKDEEEAVKVLDRHFDEIERLFD